MIKMKPVLVTKGQNRMETFFFMNHLHSTLNVLIFNFWLYDVTTVRVLDFQALFLFSL